MAREPKRVTLRDVAREAGVHVSAISAVLGQSDRATARVSADTRARVLAAAERLAYTPNRLARGLRTGHFHNVGVIHSFYFPDLLITNPYLSGILRGVLRAAHGRRYNVTLPALPWENHEPPTAGALQGQGIDGFIVVAPTCESDFVPTLVRLGSPVVVVAAEAAALGVPTVDIDNRRGIALAFAHLWGLGHRRIAFITSDVEQEDARVRREALQAEYAGRGLAAPPGFVQRLGDLSAAEPVLCLRALLALPHPPTAILALNDTIALQFVEAARECGVTVPERLSVVGFDDYPDMSAAQPPLTTLRQPLVAMGEAAALRLLSLLAGEDVAADTRFFEPELIVRQSTAPPYPGD